MVKKFIGVKKRHGDGNYEARAVIGGLVIHVGTFSDPHDAALARDLYMVKNHKNIKVVKLNNPDLLLLRAKDRPKMPTPTGTVRSNGGERKPLSATGHRFIHRAHGKFVFRTSVVIDGERHYIRKKCETLKEAIKFRDDNLGSSHSR